MKDIYTTNRDRFVVTNYMYVDISLKLKKNLDFISLYLDTWKS